MQTFSIEFLIKFSLWYSAGIIPWLLWNWFDKKIQYGKGFLTKVDIILGVCLGFTGVIGLFLVIVSIPLTYLARYLEKYFSQLTIAFFLVLLTLFLIVLGNVK